jgi:hypothetical protein
MGSQYNNDNGGIFMKPCLDVIVQFVDMGKGNRLRQFYINGGGGHRAGYSPHFRVLGDDEYLGIQFIEGPDMPVNPGEFATAKVWLMYHPNVSYDKLEVGREFEILEGSVIVGVGCVKSIVYFVELS